MGQKSSDWYRPVGCALSWSITPYSYQQKILQVLLCAWLVRHMFWSCVLFATKEKHNLRLYRYEGFYFTAPAFAEINLPYQGQVSATVNVNTENSSPSTPLHGNSWFSSEAHRSVDTLKSEYRRLAKIYHPDICELPNSSDLFKAISAEYSQLYHLVVHG